MKVKEWQDHKGEVLASADESKKDKTGTTHLSIIVQASSKSWGGGVDLCMNELDGKSVIWHTIKKLKAQFNLNEITIAAPEFDVGGFDSIITERVTAYYGFNDSPLKRIISITNQLPDDALVLRVDGLNFCVDTASISKMLEITNEKQLDLMKFQDDWPTIFCGDIYRIGALRKMANEIGGPDSSDAPYHIHPKYYLLSNSKYDCARHTPEVYSDEILNTHRLSAKTVYAERELGDAKGHAVPAGDMLSFHYKLALDNLNNPLKLLDIACGLGYGTAMLAEVCTEVVGADIDPSVITASSDRYSALDNVKFLVADAEDLPFDDNHFDAVVSFETIEHVDGDRYLSEIHRVISNGGTFILSTPQNAIGHIPVNPWHVVEYSLENLKKLVNKYFVVDKVIGLKQGPLYFDNDPVGTNTVLICHKSH